MNWWNGSTLVGLALARLTGSARHPGPYGTIIAERYPLPLPVAPCFVIGDVIFTRGSARWLLAPEQWPIRRHELRHTEQYALFGPLFLPIYAAGCAWSYALTGHFATRNPLERSAGLADGGYADLPVRPALRSLFSNA